MSDQPVWKVPLFTRGDRFRKAREDAGYSEQTAFAKALGISRDTVRHYESDQIRRLHRPTILAWSLATKTPIDWLMEGVTPDAEQHTHPEVTSARLPVAA